MGEREKEIRTDWSSILQERSGRGSGARLPAVAPLGSYDGMLVRALLSEDECIAFVRATEATGYGSTDYAQTFRGNLRLMTHDSALASKLFLRLRPHLPETLLLDPESNAAAGHVRPPGVWRLAGLNEKFRFAKYRPGDEFQPHVDAKFVCGQEQSAFSVNVYLNADFYGGATRFFGEMVWWPEGKRPVAENLAVDLSVQPECGAACIFRQPVDSCRGPSILHDGQRVTRGFKYLLRTDVLYRREEVSASFHALEDIVTDIPRPTPCAVTPTSRSAPPDPPSSAPPAPRM